MSDLSNVRHRRKKNRPTESAWRQQSLPSLRPVLTVRSAFPWTLGTGIVFIGIGVALFLAANQSLEEVIDYTDCQSTMLPTQSTNLTNTTHIISGGKQCSYSVFLDEDFNGDVKFYYGLNKFYQNSRLYLSSRNDKQLTGKFWETDGCKPLDVDNVTGYPYVPCGFIANSMFNDSFQLYYHPTGNQNDSIRVPFTVNGVISRTEQKRKFRNPVGGNLCDLLENTTKPPDWGVPLCKLGVVPSPSDYDPVAVGVGFENTDFMVWMKPAALPNFRKLYRYLYREGDDIFSSGLQRGNYTLTIDYQYPVDSFNGKKTFIIARESWAGPRNYFLAISYMVVGVFLIFVSVLFIAIHCYITYKASIS